MGVGVGHPAEDRMILEQSLEPAEIHAQRDDQQQKRKGDRRDPRQGNATSRLRRPASTRVPPVMRMKKTASRQVITASVSSQPAMSCHAGRVNRKKFSGLPKIGSTTLPSWRGAHTKRARASATPPSCRRRLPAAMASETPSAMRRRTGSTGSFSGCPPMKIVWPLGKSGRCARFRARNDPYRMRNVTAVKAAKIPHCKAQRFPEHARVAKRPKPEHVHVIRQRGPAAEEDGGKRRRR